VQSAFWDSRRLVVACCSISGITPTLSPSPPCLPMTLYPNVPCPAAKAMAKLHREAACYHYDTTRNRSQPNDTDDEKIVTRCSVSRSCYRQIRLFSLSFLSPPFLHPIQRHFTCVSSLNIGIAGICSSSIPLILQAACTGQVFCFSQ
jgi:hypothetical protein